MARRTTITYVECKTYGHSWDEYNPRDSNMNGYPYRLTLRCTRCTMTRHDFLDRQGELQARRYYRPENYRNESKITRPKLRLLIVRK
jgi:hypothetical protein